MAFVGYNFRQTLAYVTDGATEVDVLGISDGYPQTDHVDDYGWDTISSDGRRNRDSGIDARLAGINFQGNDGTQHLFVANTGNGTFDVTLAMGDPDGSQTLYVELCDVNTSNVVQSSSVIAAGVATGGSSRWMDATGVIRTSASDWVSNNASLEFTVSSGRMGLLIGSSSAQSSSTVIAHFGYEAVAPPVGGDFVFVRPQRLVRHSGQYRHG